MTDPFGIEAQRWRVVARSHALIVFLLTLQLFLTVAAHFDRAPGCGP